MLSYLLMFVPVGVGIGSLVLNIILLNKLKALSTVVDGVHQRLVAISKKLNA